MPEILDLGSSWDRNAIDLATSQNRRIPNARRREQLPEALAAARQFVIGSHRSARLRSLTGTYNCIGTAFANRRSCIEPHHVHMIIEDDGHAEVDAADVVPGDLLVYRDRDHLISHVA